MDWVIFLLFAIAVILVVNTNAIHKTLIAILERLPEKQEDDDSE